MSNLSFALTGIVTKHSTEVKNGLIFKRLNVKCSDSVEINDLLSELVSWGKATDSVTNISVIRNVDDDPYSLRLFDLGEYHICLDMDIQGEIIPVQFKTIKIAIKKKKVKDVVTREKRIEKFLEANITLEKKELDEDSRWNAMFLKHTEPNDDGKEVLKPLPMNFTQIESFSLFDMPQQPADDSEEPDEMPQVFQNG